MHGQFVERCPLQQEGRKLLDEASLRGSMPADSGAGAWLVMGTC
jgi:hypothetical protein